MHLTWTDPAGNDRSQTVPAHLKPYVDAIGLERAVRFFLAFGGAPVYIPKTGQGSGPLAEIMTADEIARLRDRFSAGSLTVPIPAKFIARVLRSGGAGSADIARQLHRTIATVNVYLRADDAKASA